MKIRILNWLLIVDIYTILLVLGIQQIPSTIIRFILGIPLLLLFPGYSLLKALFAGQSEMGSIEKIAISSIMSVAIVALIGLALNNTIWGISLEPALYIIAAFTIMASIIALIRQALSSGGIEWLVEFDVRWSAIFVMLAVVLAIIALGYAATKFRPGEAFAEFYVLGPAGKAQGYPSEFFMEDGQIVRILYSDGRETASQWGEVILGIVNHGQTTPYSIKVVIDGEQVGIMYEDTLMNQLSNIELLPNDKWEGEIGFTPGHIGDNQKVDLLLIKDDGTTEGSLSLWVDVKDSETGAP
ncbi:MAG: DUF1616 domain-containing protein [Dehalococcoidales bacterium]|nr:DUF1616 domain-containing protein [Dehalococcoidales bacterium]